MPQLTFKWPAAPSYAASDFIVSEANRHAVRFLEDCPQPGDYAALISGPEACGKTHLASSWVDRTRAAVIDATSLGTTASAQLWRGMSAALLENIHTIRDEAALFHLLRHAESHGLFVLLSARTNARNLPFALPDLTSRLVALPAAEIQAPDEELLKGFLFKSFCDHQLRVGDEVTAYIAKRIERSFAAARNAVEKLEEKSLERGREITIPMVKLYIG